MALKGDGVGARLTQGHDALLQFTDEISITAWVRRVTSTPFIIAAKGDETIDRVNYLFDITAGMLHFEYWTPSSFKISSSASPVPVGIWTLVGCSVDASANFCKLYIDGALDATRVLADAVLPTSAVGLASFVRNRSGSGGFIDYADDYIADLRIYDRPITDDEHAGIFAAGGGEPETDLLGQGLVARWPMGELGLGASAAGAGAVKDWTPAALHYDAAGSPAYHPAPLSQYPPPVGWAVRP